MAEVKVVLDSLDTATPRVPRAFTAKSFAKSAYLAIALGLMGTIAWGFWPSYFRPLANGTLSRPWIVHVHAIVFVGWVVLLVAQAALIATGRGRLHRQVGQAGIAYGAVVLLMGLIVSVAMPVMHVHASQLPVESAGLVVLYNLTDIVIFAGFFISAIHARHRPEFHARLILSATIALTGAAVGRVIQGGTPLYLLIWLAPLLASMITDLVIQRRLHPVSSISAPVFLMSFFKVPLFALSPVWPKVGGVLMSPFL